MSSFISNLSSSQLMAYIHSLGQQNSGDDQTTSKAAQSAKLESNSDDFDFKAESYNIDTPDKDYSNWVAKRKAEVVDQMTKGGTYHPDVIGAQELKHGYDWADPNSVAHQTINELNSRIDPNTGEHNNYQVASAATLPGGDNDPDNSIIYDANKWQVSSSGGKVLAHDNYDPRSAFYVVLQSKTNPKEKVIVFNTHGPAGGSKHCEGYTPQEISQFNQVVEGVRKQEGINTPVVMTGDWNPADKKNPLHYFDNNGSDMKMPGIKDIGPDGTHTWPSGNPSEWDDHIFATPADSVNYSIWDDTQEAKDASDHLASAGDFRFHVPV